MKRMTLLSVIDRVHDGTRCRMKDLEKARVFHHVCVRSAASRKEIVIALKMRPTSVSNMVNELLGQGLLMNGDAVPQIGKGRPEIRLLPNLDRFSAVAIYGRSQEIRVAAINFGENILYEQTLSFPGNATNSTISRGLRSAVQSTCDAVGDETELIGLGLSLFGLVDGSRNQWMLSSRWPRLKNLELEFLLPTSRMEILTQRTLDSELNYMLLRNPEYRSGGTVMIHWGYGIGASYSRDGRVLRSGLGTFGEIGHLPMAVERDIPCQCGSRGCLETVAALWKLLPAIRAKFSDVEEDETALGELLSTERPADVPGVEEAVTYMARALATIYTVLYPDRVVIYGPFTQNKYLVKDLTDQARNLLQPFSRTRFRLDVRSVGPDSAAIGCTAPLFYRRMREELTAL